MLRFARNDKTGSSLQKPGRPRPTTPIVTLTFILPHQGRGNVSCGVKDIGLDSGHIYVELPFTSSPLSQSPETFPTKVDPDSAIFGTFQYVSIGTSQSGIDDFPFMTVITGSIQHFTFQLLNLHLACLNSALNALQCNDFGIEQKKGHQLNYTSHTPRNPSWYGAIMNEPWQAIWACSGGTSNRHRHPFRAGQFQPLPPVPAP